MADNEFNAYEQKQAGRKAHPGFSDKPSEEIRSILNAYQGGQEKP